MFSNKDEEDVKMIIPDVIPSSDPPGNLPGDQ
jgi:hypothetical protein